MRIVVKIGTQSLLTDERTLDKAMVTNIVDQIAALRSQGHAIVLVSSGAVGAGRGLWQERKQGRAFCAADRILERQVLASVGQAHLIHTYDEALCAHGMHAAQLLMTRHDFRQRRHFVNVARLLEELLQRPDILPIVNENDAVSVEELVFTDNDQLASLIAAQINADRLIMLTNVDGVYAPADEGRTPQPLRIIDPAENWPRIGRQTSAGGRGGMFSKMEIARKMARIGITVQIARARDTEILPRLIANTVGLGTRIVPHKKPAAKKRWLAVHLEEPRGAVTINDCLVETLHTTNKALSILPVGITAISGTFEKGDIVEIRNETGERLGHGQARYGAESLRGHLGQARKPAFIHYDALHWA
ncbi:MAG: glutamate 5-kinase [Alphaproteobacteria bacterium]|nr:glutamate 5-kinase [Alphaproteobacteria bacterium]